MNIAFCGSLQSMWSPIPAFTGTSLWQAVCALSGQSFFGLALHFLLPKNSAVLQELLALICLCVKERSSLRLYLPFRLPES